MPATAEALIHQILHPALPAAGAPATPAPPRVRQTAAVLIGRILNPAELSPEPRASAAPER